MRHRSLTRLGVVLAAFIIAVGCAPPPPEDETPDLREITENLRALDGEPLRPYLLPAAGGAGPAARQQKARTAARRP